MEGEVNPWVLLASGEIVEVKGKGGVGDKLDVEGVGGIVLKYAGESLLVSLLKKNEEVASDLFTILSRNDVRPNELIKAFSKVPEGEVEVIIKELKRFKDLDEVKLKDAVKQYRKDVGIQKQRVKDKRGREVWEGGTVGAGKTHFDNPEIDNQTFIGASSNAQAIDGKGAVHNKRYESPQDFWATKNHAEQTILGDIADQLDKQFKGISKSELKGSVSITVDQAVCSACRQGLDSSSNAAAGTIKQFSLEHPNIRLILSNTESGRN